MEIVTLKPTDFDFPSYKKKEGTLRVGISPEMISPGNFIYKTKMIYEG